jgi:uncharacterized protein
MNMQKDSRQTDKQDLFAPFKDVRVGQLTTFRRNGQGVATPVGIRFADGKVYFTTWSTTGKVKRLARNPRVELAPFSKIGMKVVGPGVEGIARCLTEDEFAVLSAHLKPGMGERFWSLIYRLRGWQAIHYEVSSEGV